MTTAPKKWREWMPLDVDDFLTSDDILVMTPEEFKGYVVLILQQWKSDTGYLPSNLELIARKSRLTPQEWERSKDVIMAKFELTPEGYSNARCRAELDKVMAQFHAKSGGAKATNEKRWGKSSLSDRSPIAHVSLPVAPTSPSLSPSHSPSSQKEQEPKSQEPEKNQIGSSEGRAGERQEQFTESVKGREEESASGCVISRNPTPRRENEPVDDSNWPATAPSHDEAMRDLLKAHPRPSLGHHATMVAIEQIGKLAQERGKGEWEAYTYLLGRFMAYKTATDGWPARDRQYINTALNFLNDEVYRHDDAMWQRNADGNDDDQHDAGFADRLLRKAAETGGGGGIDLSTLPRPGSQEYRELQAASRARTHGLRHTTAYRRPF